MNKVLLLLPMLLALLVPSLAQDLIIKKNGDETKAKVLEINPSEIKYKRFDFLEGPTYTIYVSDVFMIKFENGSKQLFGQTSPAAAPAPKVPQIEQPAQGPANAGIPTPASPDKPTRHSARIYTKEGVRIGATMLGPGELADELREEYSTKPFITQIGWQLETPLFASANGLSGQIEWIPLVGGLEQGMFLPNITGLVSLRGSSGMQVGAGPNFSLAGAGFTLSAGFEVSTTKSNFPVSFLVVPSGKGSRFSLLVGFNMRKG